MGRKREPFKTSIDFTVSRTLVIMAILLMTPIFLSSAFRESSIGLAWFGFCLLISFVAMLKVAQIKIDDNQFSKTDILLIRNRTFQYSEIEKIKIIQNRSSNSPEIDLFAILGFKRRYSNFRVLKVKLKGRYSVKIDERIMDKNEFDKVLRRIKNSVQH